ncbi:unnamed protein product, partial [Cladocopium goreaui]
PPLMVIKRSEIRKISVTIPCGTYCETGAEQSLPLKYEVASLVFNTEADPVATIRGINGQAYIQLERQNMPGEEVKKKRGITNDLKIGDVVIGVESSVAVEEPTSKRAKF